MGMDDRMEELLCNGRCIISCLSSMEVDHFREAVYKNGKCIVAFGGSWEVSNEVHADA